MPTPTELLLASLWQKNQPKIRAHLGILEAAARTHTLGETQKAEAISSAHKLAGSLGMYGYPAATLAARALEQELELPTPDPAHLERHLAHLKLSLPDPDPPSS